MEDKQCLLDSVPFKDEKLHVKYLGTCHNRLNTSLSDISGANSSSNDFPVLCSGRTPDTVYPPVGFDVLNFLPRYNIFTSTIQTTYSILPYNTAYSANSVQHTGIQQIHTAYSNQLNTAYRSPDTCMTRSYTKELFTPLDNPKRVFRSKRMLFETPGLVESSSPKFDFFSNIEERLEEEAIEVMAKTMEQYKSKTRGDYGNEPVGSILTWEVLKSKFLNKYCPPARTAKKMEEINNFQQEPDESLFRAWERFKELLMKCPQHYLTDMQEVILFYNGLDVPTRQILDSKGVVPSMTASNAKVAIQQMAEYSQKWHNRTSSNTRNTKTFDRLAFIQAQLNNLGIEIKKVNEKVYAAQERGFEILPSSTEINPRDHVKSISTAKADSNRIHHIGSDPYAEARELKILDTYPIRTTLHDNTLPQKEKDPGSFTLPCDLAHTRLTVELTDRTIKHPKGIAKNVLVRIGKFIFPIDFIILDIPEDDDVSRVYMLNERANLDSKLIGGDINKSFDPLYGDYIELNDLDKPLEPMVNQDNSFEPTTNENVNEISKQETRLGPSAYLGKRQGIGLEMQYSRRLRRNTPEGLHRICLLAWMGWNADIEGRGLSELCTYDKIGGKYKGGFGGNVRSYGGSCVGRGGRGGSIVRRGGGSLAKHSMESKDGLGGGGFIDLGGRSSSWVGASGGEVKGGGVDFGVSRTLIGEIPSDIMGESVGETFGVNDRANDVIAEFCGPSLWKELSKETSSKILPYGDGSGRKTFKPVASLIAKEKLK
ncbi:retrovirus-related pol polyprotein from transposon TNT 1-94 [Tanacetum coccineum]